MHKDPIHVGSVEAVVGVTTLTMADDDNHARQRRALSHSFSQKALVEQEYIVKRYVDQFIENLKRMSAKDEAFNMVEFQEEMKYGRSSGIALGGVDFVKLAEAFGAKGFRVHDASELEKVMEEALAYEGVALVDVRIDYSRAKDLAGNLLQDSVG